MLFAGTSIGGAAGAALFGVGVPYGVGLPVTKFNLVNIDRQVVGVFLAVCDDAPSCCRRPYKMPAIANPAGCDILLAITEAINTLFLVVNLLTFCVMCCYRSRLVFTCCF